MLRIVLAILFPDTKDRMRHIDTAIHYFLHPYNYDILCDWRTLLKHFQSQRPDD